jgi:hypothetical protein
VYNVSTPLDIAACTCDDYFLERYVTNDRLDTDVLYLQFDRDLLTGAVEQAEKWRRVTNEFGKAYELGEENLLEPALDIAALMVFLLDAP